LLTNQHLAGCSRWHVLKNLRDALENFLARRRKPIAEIAKEFKDSSILPASFRESKKQRIQAKSKLRARQERIQCARALFVRYNSITRVARELPASRTIVYKAIRTEDLPTLRNNARGCSLLDRWVPELELRFARGLPTVDNFGVSCAKSGIRDRMNEFVIGYGFGVINKRPEMQRSE
jgi:transposase